MRKYHLQVHLTGWLLCSDSGHGLEGCHLDAISRSDSNAICPHNFCIQTILSKMKLLRHFSLLQEENFTGVEPLYLG